MTDDTKGVMVVCAKCDEFNDIILLESWSVKLDYEQASRADEADYLVAMVKAVKLHSYEMAAVSLDRPNKSARLVVYVVLKRECKRCGATLEEMVADVEPPDGPGFLLSTGS